MRVSGFIRAGAFRPWGFRLAAEFLLACGLLLLALRTPGAPQTADSYSYLLLGDSLLHGHYVSPAVRDLTGILAIPQPSRSFPPLWPLLVGCIRRLTGAGIMAGVAANLLSLWLLVYAARRLGRQLVGGELLYSLLLPVLFVLLDPPFRLEAAGGRAVPLALALLLLAIAQWLDVTQAVQPGPRALAAAGLLCGLLPLVRFDLLPVAGILVGLAILPLLHRCKPHIALRNWALLAGFAALPLLPWTIRNLREFGAPFASDNLQTPATLYEGIPAYAFTAPGHPFPDRTVAPEGWRKQRLAYLRENLRNLWRRLGFLLLPGMGLLLLGLGRINARERLFLALAGGYAVLQIGLVSLTPYHDARYFSGLVFFALLAFSLLAVRALAPPRSGWRIILGAGLLLFAAVNMAGILPLAWREPSYLPPIENAYQELGGWLVTRVPPQARIGAPLADPLSFHSGLPAVNLPLNVAADGPDFRAWLSAWRPDYIVAPPGWVDALGLQSWRIAEFSADGQPFQLLQVAALAEPDFAATINPLRAGCAENRMDACFLLAQMELAGRGVGRDEPAALRLFSRTCAAGNPSGCEAQAEILLTGPVLLRDAPAALQLFIRACDAGRTEACARAGGLLWEGTLGPASPARAAPYLERACDGGNFRSCHLLGVAYQSNRGIKRDFAKAAMLYRRACDGKYAPGCGSIGFLHAKGQGVAADPALAMSLYQQGCQGGDPFSCEKLHEAGR